MQEAVRSVQVSSNFDQFSDDEKIMQSMSIKLRENENGEFLHYITQEHDDLSRIVHVSNLIRRVLYDQTTHFSVVESRSGRVTEKNTPVGNQLYALVNKGLALQVDWHIRYSLNPYFQLYTSRLASLHHALNYGSEFSGLDIYKQRKRRAEILNAAIQLARTEAQSPAFKTQIKTLQRNINKKRQGLEEYFDGIFEAGRSVHMMRIELFYDKKEIETQAIKSKSSKTISKFIQSLKPFVEEEADRREKPSSNGFSTDEIIKHKEKFLSIVKSGLTPHLLGYVWKLDYTFEIGFRYHVILCFDTSSIFSREQIREILNNVWRHQVTGGRGRCYFYPEGEKDHRGCGTGLMSRESPDFDENIATMIKYMTRPELYLRLELPNKGKIFGRSYIKSNRASEVD